MVNRIYEHYKHKLSGQKTVKLATSTVMIQETNRIVIEFNNRKIITMMPDGTHIIDTGGWRTPSVRRKVELAIEKLGYTITQQSGIWYVAPTDLRKCKRYVYADGMKIRADGSVVGADIDVQYPTASQRMIKQYVALWVQAWERGHVPPANPSDPYSFYKVAIGDLKPNLVEMRQQMIEYYRGGYFFGSLLVVAINDVGGSKTGRIDLIGKMHIQDWLAHGCLPPSKLLSGSAYTIRRLMRQFLFKLHGFGKVANGKQSR